MVYSNILSLFYHSSPVEKQILCTYCLLSSPHFNYSSFCAHYCTETYLVKASVAGIVGFLSVSSWVSLAFLCAPFPALRSLLLMACTWTLFRGLPSGIGGLCAKQRGSNVLCGPWNDWIVWEYESLTAAHCFGNNHECNLKSRSSTTAWTEVNFHRILPEIMLLLGFFPLSCPSVLYWFLMEANS